MFELRMVGNLKVDQFQECCADNVGFGQLRCKTSKNFTEIGIFIIFLTLSNVIFCILMTVLLLFTKTYYNKINIICTSFC